MTDALPEKIVVLVLVGLLSLVCGLVPLLLARLTGGRFCCRLSGLDSQLLLSCVLCLGSGVLLATVFTHMLPEIHETFEALQQSQAVPAFGAPLGEVTVCCGFLLVYLIEELVRVCLSQQRRCQRQAASCSYATFRPASEAATTEERQQLEAKDSAGMSPPTAHLPSLQEDAELITSTDHSHGVDLASVHVLRAYLIVLALSVHSIFEGLAVAFENSAASVWALFAAIISHKCIINFCLGEQLMATGRSTCFVVANMCVLSFSSSLGVLLGVAVSEINADVDGALAATGFLQSLAAGTILYVVFFELLGPERQKHSNGLIKFTAVLCGFLIMVMIQAFSGHSM